MARVCACLVFVGPQQPMTNCSTRSPSSIVCKELFDWSIMMMMMMMHVDVAISVLMQNSRQVYHDRDVGTWQHCFVRCSMLPSPTPLPYIINVCLSLEVVRSIFVPIGSSVGRQKGSTASNILVQLDRFAPQQLATRLQQEALVRGGVCSVEYTKCTDDDVSYSLYSQQIDVFIHAW